MKENGKRLNREQGINLHFHLKKNNLQKYEYSGNIQQGDLKNSPPDQ